MLDRESWLLATLIELADTGVADFSEEEYSRGFAGRLAELVRPGQVEVLLTGASHRPCVTAGSGQGAADLGLFETRNHEGPCTDCSRTDSQMCDESFGAADTPWPGFAVAARAAGFWWVYCLPLRHLDETVGAVCVLGAQDYRLSAADQGMARALAEAVAIGILRQRALRASLRTAEQLQEALDSRVVIEQAKGALAAWLGVVPDEAFRLLRAYARRNSRRLAEVADEVVRRELPAQALVRAESRSRVPKPGVPHG